MKLISALAITSIMVPIYGQGVPTGGHGPGGRGAGGHLGGGPGPAAGAGHRGGVPGIVPHGPVGFGPQVNHVPADVTGHTFSRPESTFSRSFIASAPYLHPSTIGAFPDSGFLPGALPPHGPWSVAPNWNSGFYWMPTFGKPWAGFSMWGPFDKGYPFPGQGQWNNDWSRHGNNNWNDWHSRGYSAGYPYGGFYPYTGYYGYSPYGWGGDGTFVMVGDSALRAWTGEPVDGYPPQVYGGPMPWTAPMPWPGMPMPFQNPPPLPEGVALAQFTGEPETIVLDFPPGSRVRH